MKVAGADNGFLVEWRHLTRDTTARRRTALLIGSEAVIYIGSARGGWTDQATSVPPPPVIAAPGSTARRDICGKASGGDLQLPQRYRIRLGIVLGEFPETVILALARRFLTQVTPIALVILLVGLAAAWTFSRRLTTPLQNLTAAAGAIASGGHGDVVPVDREDELGQLAGAFNRMATQIDAESAARKASEEQWRLLFDS